MAPSSSRPGISSLVDGLNPQQQAAVLYDAGPLLIVAGAGSGKTTVLTHRIAHMVHERGARPDEVLAITFTNKAAGEMRERLQRLLGGQMSGMWVATFHSAFLRILRAHSQSAGLRPGFVIYDPDDCRKLLANVTEDCGYDPKVLKVQGTAALISRAKNSLISPSVLVHRTGSSAQSARARIFAEYQSALARVNAVDFDDILVKTVELFREHPEVLAHYQQRFRHLLVDEYQDTNMPQHEAIVALAREHRSVTCVGDGDQGIYGFRGAHIGNIIHFDQSFPEVHTILLEQNYRSTPTILEAANEVIAHNAERTPKRLFTTRAGGAEIEVRRFVRGEDEASWIAAEARSLLASGIRGPQIAVLCRTKVVGRGIEAAMLGRQVPCRFIGAVPFFSRSVVKDLLAYCRLVVNPDDEIAFRRVVNVPRRGVGDTSVATIRRFVRGGHAPFGTAIRTIDQIGLPPRAADGLASFLGVLDDARRIVEAGGNAGEMCQAIVDTIGFYDHLAKLGDDVAETQIEAVETIIEMAGRHNSVEAFLELTSLSSETDELDEEDRRVLIMTVHAAKGLEFPIVFVPSLEEGVFPGLRLSSPGTIGPLDHEQLAELEEERRLAYVAITRAQERLVLSWALERRRFAVPEVHQPSRFLSELPERLRPASMQRSVGATAGGH
ncbi:MAG: ATP-dependent helicase [Acidimicrobiales bacterium]